MNLCKISTGRMTFVASEKTFAAEISDFGRDFRLGQLYPDAADVGFILVSHRTGAEIPFCLLEEVRNDGDLVQWVFVPTPEIIRRIPHCAGYKVVLFND